MLKTFVRRGWLEPHEAEEMLQWDHGGGFSLDASVRIEAWDRAALERLLRCEPTFPTGSSAYIL